MQLKAELDHIRQKNVSSDARTIWSNMVPKILEVAKSDNNKMITQWFKNPEEYSSNGKFATT